MLTGSCEVWLRPLEREGWFLRREGEPVQGLWFMLLLFVHVISRAYRSTHRVSLRKQGISEKKSEEAVDYKREGKDIGNNEGDFTYTEARRW